jgi:hypothetical protein
MPQISWGSKTIHCGNWHRTTENNAEKISRSRITLPRLLRRGFLFDRTGVSPLGRRRGSKPAIAPMPFRQNRRACTRPRTSVCWSRPNAQTPRSWRRRKNGLGQAEAPDGSRYGALPMCRLPLADASKVAGFIKERRRDLARKPPEPAMWPVIVIGLAAGVAMLVAGIVSAKLCEPRRVCSRRPRKALHAQPRDAGEAFHRRRTGAAVSPT